MVHFFVYFRCTVNFNFVYMWGDKKVIVTIRVLSLKINFHLYILFGFYISLINSN